MASAQPEFLAPPRQRELPSGLGTPGNGAQHPHNTGRAQGMAIAPLTLCSSKQDSACLKNIGGEREFGILLPLPHLCLFCWGRFSGSIYIPLGLGSLQRDERSIWIQSHL